MRYSALTDRLQGLGGAKWEIHAAARQMKREGRDVIELTIGEPDVATPTALLEAATAAMQMTAILAGFIDGLRQARRRGFGPSPPAVNDSGLFLLTPP